MSSCRAQSTSESGQSMVEFTLSVLVVLTVIFGIVELSRVLLAYNALAEAARAGVRYATVHGGDRSGSGTEGPSGAGCDGTPPSGTSVAPNVVGVVTSDAGALSSTSLTVSVCYPDGNNSTGSRITVTAYYSYVPAISFLGFVSPINLSSTTEGTIAY